MYIYIYILTLYISLEFFSQPSWTSPKPAQVSMISARLLDILDLCGRAARGTVQRPFGGLQVLLCRLVWRCLEMPELVVLSRSLSVYYIIGGEWWRSVGLLKLLAVS